MASALVMGLFLTMHAKGDIRFRSLLTSFRVDCIAVMSPSSRALARLASFCWAHGRANGAAQLLIALLFTSLRIFLIFF